jgi:Fe-Mn family superoxide dismutase
MFTINSLPYSYEALEPVIDRETMEIHHDKHHQTYCDNLNKLVGERGLENSSLEDLKSSEFL